MNNNNFEPNLQKNVLQVSTGTSDISSEHEHLKNGNSENFALVS